MAIANTIWPTSKYIPLAPGCCEDVILCIDPECAGITADGSGIVTATIENTGRALGLGNEVPKFINPRCSSVFQYSIHYDDEQMAINQSTGLPYKLNCACIVEVFPYACIYNKLSTLGDWVVDRNNVVQTVDEETGEFRITIPVIDRINNTSIGSFTLTLDALFDNTFGTFSAFDTPTGGITFTDGEGTETIIQIVSQDADNLAEAGTDDGVFIGLSADAGNNLFIGNDGRIYSPYNDIDAVADSSAVSVDISSVGTYIIGTGSVLTITNTSPTRAQEIMIVGDNTLQADVLATGVWQFRVEEEVDGGGFAPLSTSNWGPFGANMAFPFISPVNNTYTVPAASSITIQRRAVIETLSGTGATSSINSYAIGMRAVVIGK